MLYLSSIVPAAVFGLSLASIAAAAGNSTFNAGSIDSNTKASWCLAQSNNCLQLCDNDIDDNNCDQETLEFTCTCSDGSTPDLDQFTGTIPTFECVSSLNTCVGSTTDLDTQKQCKETYQCGTKDPADATFSPSASATPTPTASASSSQSAAATTTQASATTTALTAATNAAALRSYSGELLAGAGLMAAARILL